MKKEINIFISYAHKNQVLANKFIEDFFEYIKPSKKYNFLIWYDKKLKSGEVWNDEIKRHINKSSCAILLISPSFLNSKYIIETELPEIMKDNKVILPVLLSKIDFERHDLKGLEKYQIFNLKVNGVSKNYTELKEKKRQVFLSNLFIDLEERLSK